MTRRRGAFRPWLGAALLGCATAGLATAVAAQESFQQCLSRLQTAAIDGGVQRATAETIIAGIEEPRRDVVQADRNQPEFIDTFADYLGRRISDARVERGRALLAEHRALLDSLTRDYGVPGHYLLAFWALETNFGGYLGDVSVFEALSTLACDARRSAYFTTEFVNALLVADRGDVAHDDMIGSWAGAMGQTQFMPSNYLAYAVDGNGDGRIDLWNSAEDALASGANLLANLGWQSGFRWGREVLLPEGFDFSLAGLDSREALTRWRELGITDVNGNAMPALAIEAALLVPSGAAGPAFLVYDNFEVIMRWNRSEHFALTVGHLADRFAGSAGLENPPPDSERITRDQIVQLQRYLIEAGHEIGTADGILGSRSRAALRALQADRGLVADGFVSVGLLRALGIESP